MREAMISAGRGLDRDQLDHGQTQDKFWTATVEPTFKDALVTPSVNISGVVTGISQALVPQSHRRGSELKDNCGKARSDFTKAYERWKDSGQNNTAFEAFVPVTSHTLEVSAMGGKLLMLFQVLKGGKADEVKDLVKNTVRSMPEEAMVDSLKTGDTANEIRNNRLQRRRDVHESFDDSAAKLSGFADAKRKSRKVQRE